MLKLNHLFPVLINIFGISIFVFLLWKRLKEDYFPDKIFSASLIIIAGIILGFVIGRAVIFPWWFWMCVLGFAIAQIISSWFSKIKVRELFNASFIGILLWLAFFYLGDSVKNSSLISFVAFGVTLILVGLYHFFDLHYRDFSWYRSGKIGFSGLVAGALFFLIRGLVGVFSIPVVGFVGRIDMIVSFVVSFIFVLLTYNLSRLKI